MARYGPKPRPPHERVLAMVDYADDGCWLFTGLTRQGYGRIHVVSDNNVRRFAHRVVYEALVGPIPEGHSLHHRCEVRRCVNPAHLIPVTTAQHNRAHAGTTCSRCGGEDWWIDNRGWRHCRPCSRGDANQRYRDDPEPAKARARERYAARSVVSREATP